MANNFMDSRKQEHGMLGYEVTAVHYMLPFNKGWARQSVGNTYSLNDTRVAIRHYYSVGDKTRWTVIYKYKGDRYFTIEVYDAVQVDGEFYNRTVYNDIAYNLYDAVHLANIHKSDK